MNNNQIPMQQNQPSFFGNMQSQPQFSFPPMPTPPSNFSHQNIAQFGSSCQPQQFIGQNIFQGPWNGGNKQ